MSLPRLIIFTLLIFPSFIFGQDTQFQWANPVGGTSDDYTLATGFDASGNVYTMGTFTFTADMDPGPGVFNMTAPGGKRNLFIVKYDAGGHFIWARQLGEDALAPLVPRHMTVDADGNLYVTGSFYGTLDFDPGPAVANRTSSDINHDAFLLKLDANGTFEWAHMVVRSEQTNIAYMVDVAASGNVYVTGTFNGLTDFDPGPANLEVNSEDKGIYISKFTKDGNFVWSKQFSGTDGKVVRSMEVDEQENVYTTGNFNGMADFDPGPAAYNLISQNLPAGASWGDAFVSKLDANGNFVWAKHLEGLSNQFGYGITVDLSGNVIITGEFDGKTDFDPGPGTFILSNDSWYREAFVMKLDANGGFLWAREFDGGPWQHPRGVACDATGNIYVTGWFMGTTDFDPGPAVYNFTSADNQDNGFISKLNAGGNFVFAKQIRCESYVEIYGIELDPANNIYVAGAFSKVADLDPETGVYSLTAKGSLDGFVLKLSQCKWPTGETITVTSCGAYTLNNQTYTGSGTYIQRLVNVAGCDSLLTLQLTVQPLPPVLFDVSICEGENYWGHMSGGTYRDTLVAVNGCDSIRILNLRVNPVKRTTVNISLCKGKSYYAGGADQTRSGVYMDTLATYPGCDSIITTTLTVHDLPVPDLGVDRGICAGTTLSLMPGSFANYEWMDQSTSSALTVSGIGIYWVKVKDNQGCSASDTVAITRILPNPAGFLKPTDSICQYEKLQLLPAGNYKNYTWSNGSNGSSLTVETPGRYILEVQDNNSCYGSDTTYLYSKLCRTGVYIPTGFTPNGDGSNDLFRAIVYGKVVSFRLEVYNRWGEMIFSTTDPYKGWDGKVKGVDNSTSVFLWRCNYQLEGDELRQEKGVVTLVR